MRCASCHRRLAAVAVWVSGKPWGPVCAQRAGLLVGKKRVAASVAVTVDADQLDFFGVEI